MAVLYAVMLIAAAGNTAMHSILPAIGTKLSIPDAWVSMTFSWSALLWVVTAPRWARISNRRGRKALMAIGIIGFTSSMLLCGLVMWAGLNSMIAVSTTFIIFALFRSLYGALGSAAPPAVQAYVAARTEPEERTQALSLVASSFGLGTVIGPAVAPLLIFPQAGLAGPMLIFALFGVIVLILLRWRLPNDTPRFAAHGTIAPYPTSSNSPLVSETEDRLRQDDGTFQDNQQHEDTANRPANSRREIKESSTLEPPALAWRDPRTSPWLLAGVIGGQAQAMILGIVGFLILDRLNLRLSPDEAAEPTGIVLMSGAIASLLAQWGIIPTLKPSPRFAVLSGAALGGLGALVTGVSNDLHGIVIGFALASLGFGLFRPGFTAGASLAVSRRDQGTVAGMTASVNGSAYIISPALGVYIYGQSPLLAFSLMAIFCAFLLGWGWNALKPSSFPRQ